MQITDKTVAVVTGGASGLGGATVRRLVADGAKVVILDLPSSPGAELAAELGDAVRFAPTDVRDEAQVQAAIDIARELGELRIAVTCAGVATPGRVIGRSGPLPLDTYRSVIEINLIGTFNVLRLAAEQMAKNEPINRDGGRGVIINTASVAAYEGQIGQAAYSASKGGVVGMTLPVARDLASYGIRVNTIVPGLINTPLFQALPEPAVKALGQQVLFPQRLGEPDEIAHLAVAIIENDYINGECIRMDGGIRMQPR